MRGINKVILVGRLGKDPEIRYSSSGTAYATFSVATESRQKNSEGEWTGITEWHSIKTFGKQAEFTGEYLRKGKLVYVEGRLQTSSWEDNGQKRYRTDIIASSIQLLSSDKTKEEKPTTQQVQAETQASEPELPF